MSRSAKVETLKAREIKRKYEIASNDEIQIIKN